MRVAALAGGVGAGKLLRGLARVVPPEDVTVVGNVADDLTLHGLHISPDLDSVLYWLAGEMDRERGWGRGGDTFRTLRELKRLGGAGWFTLGDLDLATHLYRTQRLDQGAPLSVVTDELRTAFGVTTRILPSTDDRVMTWMLTEGVKVRGGPTPDAPPREVFPTPAAMPFQHWWVAYRGEPVVEAIDFRGAEDAKPGPGVLEALAAADAVVICPSNPVVSVGPILAVPGIADAVRERRDRVVGISPIVGGAPVAGMADRLMPAWGLEVSARGAAEAYRDLLAAWVIDERDAGLAGPIEDALDVRVGVTDTIMTDDERAEALARAALELLG
ncbi:MAG TPA: 2-phospho-L-lactate transferase [Actinomycetota bacterium]